jgi:hypothetical protein
MESWLSRSLFANHNGVLAIKEPFHESRWNSGYQGAFSQIMMEFWLSRSLFTNHDGILAIKEPFHESRWNPGYQGAFHTIKFTKCTNWGKTLFIYITKSIYTGFASLKTLPLDLEPPLQGKEYDPPYCNEIAKKKANVFVTEITYRFVFQILFFWNVNLRKKEIFENKST